MTQIIHPAPITFSPTRDLPSAIEISIVMPCLNEAETVATCVSKARSWLDRRGVSGEVIIADNGSSDGSQQLAVSSGARVVPIEERGYGNALLGGIAAARGLYIIMGDADDSYDFTSLDAFLDQLRAGADLVMGNRFAGGIKPNAMPPLHQYLGNPVLTRVGQLFFRSSCGDFHCGLRGFRKDAITQLDLRTTGMEFASEMVVKATMYGLRITEVPTTLSPDGRSRPPHLRSWRDGWRHLRFLLLYSPRWLFLYPGLALMLAGTAIGVWLLGGPRAIGAVVFDVHTLLYAAMAVILGFQAIMFAIFTKVFAISEGLHPPDKRLELFFGRASLETSLLLGGSMFLCGLVGSLFALDIWGNRDFGGLDPSRTLRVVIPAVVLLVLGCQVIFSSFFLSILKLRRK